MEAVILVIHLIVAIAIIVTILLQPSEAGGLVSNAGSMSNMSQRRSGNPLTRATTILAGIFFMTSLVLAISAGRHPVQQGILEIGKEKTMGIEEALEQIIPDVPIGGIQRPSVNKKDSAPEKAAPAPAKKPKKDAAGTEPEAPISE